MSSGHHNIDGRYHTSDGIRCLTSRPEQARVGASATRFLHGSSFYPQKTAPLGSRALHGSRVVSESAKGAFANRPLSPHLAVKKPQLSATYSISHRIFGAGVASLILLSPILMKYSETFDV